MKPKYTLDKIKFSIDPGTYERAVALYENNKIKEFEDDGCVGYSAIVQGTQAYEVYVHARSFDLGSCDCYLGQNNTLCKHMVAVAIYAVMNGKPLKEEDKQQAEVGCSGVKGELSEEDLKKVNIDIALALRYIKSYSGPSRKWFAYQNSLSEGCARLTDIVSKLPVSRQTADLLVKLLLRLDKKLCNVVDDSDGTVGDFMMEVVLVLVEFAKIDFECVKTFKQLCERQTCFDWEDPLVKILDEGFDSF